MMVPMFAAAGLNPFLRNLRLAIGANLKFDAAAPATWGSVSLGYTIKKPVIWGQCFCKHGFARVPVPRSVGFTGLGYAFFLLGAGEKASARLFRFAREKPFISRRFRQAASIFFKNRDDPAGDGTSKALLPLNVPVEGGEFRLAGWNSSAVFNAQVGLTAGHLKFLLIWRATFGQTEGVREICLKQPLA